MDLNIVLLIVLAVVAVGLLIWLLGRRTGDEPVRPARPAPAEKAALPEADPVPAQPASAAAPVGLVSETPPVEAAPEPVAKTPAPAAKTPAAEVTAPEPAPAAKAPAVKAPAAPKTAAKKAEKPAAKSPVEKKPAAARKAPAKAPAPAPKPAVTARAPAKTQAEPPAGKAPTRKPATPAAKAPVERKPATARPKPAATAPDNLLQLKGVGPKLATLLTGLGITRFDQIAGWTEDDVARIDPQLGTFKGRIGRDKWIEQAGYLAKGDIKGFEAKFGKLDSEN